MPDFFQEPRATYPVLRRPPGELEPWTSHTVSMMQALQSGARLTIYPGRIVWKTPDGATLGFTNRNQPQLRNVGVLTDISHVQGMDLDEDVELLFLITKNLVDAARNNMPIAQGRRPDPDGRHHGYVIWQRQRTPNHPRIEISPDQVITLWYHWPGDDDPPSQPASP